MIQLLQSGMAANLDDAYEKAIRLDPNFLMLSKVATSRIDAQQNEPQQILLQNGQGRQR
jgi:hypothetical protein